MCQADFPGGSDGKESACNPGDLGLISGLGRYPAEGNNYPLQYSGLENSMDRGSGGIQCMESQSQTGLSDTLLIIHLLLHLI